MEGLDVVVPCWCSVPPAATRRPDYLSAAEYSGMHVACRRTGAAGIKALHSRWNGDISEHLN